MKRMLTYGFSLLCLLLSLASCGKQPTWQEQYDLGVRYLSEGNYEEAVIAFTAAIEIDPKQAPAYVGRGDAYIGLGETEENLVAAQADYELAMELDEACAEAYLGLANVYFQMGEYEKALGILRQGIDKTGEQALVDREGAIEEWLTGGSSATESANTAAGADALYFENCAYEYQGKQVIVTYTDDHCSDSIVYTMKDGANRIYAMAILGLAETDTATPVKGSGSFVDSWNIVEVDTSGNYVAGGWYDQNGKEIDD